jgi:DNA polymerase III subunit delta
MKIPNKDIENFIKKIPADLKAILLYGPNQGLIKARIEVIKESFSFTENFQYDKIKNSPGLVLDSINSQSLFSSNNKIRMATIECGGSSLNENFISLIKNSKYKGLLLFYAGELGTDSSLRKNFEKLANTAAIPCYLDDYAMIIKLIEYKLKQHSLVCDHKLITIIAKSIDYGDRALIINEIEKILLFIGDQKKQITQQDLHLYIKQQEETSFDNLCYSLSLKKLKNIEIIINNLQHEGNNIVAITRVILRHFYRIYQVKNSIKQGKTIQQSIDSLYPSVFFKYIDHFAQSVKLWSEADLIAILKKLNNIELMAKTNPTSANLMLRNLILYC